MHTAATHETKSLPDLTYQWIAGREAGSSILCSTTAAVDIQRPWFLARRGLVPRSVRRACSGATLNATELRALGCSAVPARSTSQWLLSPPILGRVHH